MDVPKLSTNALKTLQRAVRDALAKDDQTPAGQEKLYLVRELPDWREASDELEAELDHRGENYPRVPW